MTQARTPLLDESRILETLTRLRDRIQRRFPGSGLGRVTDDLVTIAQDTTTLVASLGRPNWPIRAAVWLTIGAVIVVLVTLAATLRMPSGINGLAGAVQTAESLTNDLVFLGIAMYFLTSLEDRFKRKRALAALYRLRSIAHIVDMHQLTKDPEQIAEKAANEDISGDRALTQAELGRYLDYSSDLLSIIAKLAALHIQHFNDAVTLAAVNELEALCTGLSGKIWQKITLLDRT